jgi:branched-chain amino acid transport system ATP-binding protein
MAKPIVLEMNDVHSCYEELEILKGITLSVHANEIVALIGPNGAGKSTVIKSLFNFAEVTKGKILFQEKEITHSKPHELVALGIGYVNQGQIVFSNLTVLENLMIGADLLQNKKIVQQNLDSVFSRFPVLKERQKKLAYGLSGGQRQQLALGRALMQNPLLLLLDEPSLGLSPKLQKELFATIAALQHDGTSILLVEQNAKKAIEIADRTYVLEDGKIVLEGGKEILENKKIKEIYLGGRY